MAKQNEALFEESSQGAVSAITAVTVIASIVLVLGGLVTMSYGFSTPAEGVFENPQDIWVFAGGLAATFIGFSIPFSILSSTGK